MFFVAGKSPVESEVSSPPDEDQNLEKLTSNLPTNSEDEDSAVLAQLENVIAKKLAKPKKHKSSHHNQHEQTDPSLLCVPGKKSSQVHRLEKSSQDFKPSEDTDAQVIFGN